MVHHVAEAVLLVIKFVSAKKEREVLAACKDSEDCKDNMDFLDQKDP